MSRFYLVTGGSGFIGAALVKRLLNEGNRVRCFDNDSRGRVSKFEKHPLLELVTGDIRDLDAVVKAGKGVDSVIHLAYVNGTEFFYTKPDLVLDVAVRGMMNVIDCCDRNKISDLVLASSSEVYQTPPQIPTDEKVPLIVPDVFNPRYSYGGGKIICELLALHHAARRMNRVVIFRPHNVYGPDMGREHVVPQFILRAIDLCQKFKSGPLQFEIQGDGSQKRSFVYIDDFTDGLHRVITAGQHKEIYHIGTQDEWAIKEVAQLIVEKLGREIALVPGNEPKGATQRRVPNTERLMALGYQPKIRFAEGIERTIEWYQKGG